MSSEDLQVQKHINYIPHPQFHPQGPFMGAPAPPVWQNASPFSYNEFGGHLPPSMGHGVFPPPPPQMGFGGFPPPPPVGQGFFQPPPPQMGLGGFPPSFEQEMGMMSFDPMGLDSMGMGSMGLDPMGDLMGGMFLSESQKEAYNGQMDMMADSFETRELAHNDLRTLKPIAKMFNEYRFLGSKWFENDRVDRFFNNIDMNDKNDVHKLMALNDVYNQEYGNGNPLAFIKAVRNTSINANGHHNNKLEMLKQAAIKGQNINLAAALIKSAEDGWGTDDSLVRSILVDSKDSLGEKKHARFVTRTAEAFEQMHGKSLEDFIRNEYHNPWLGILFTNKQGKEYLKIIDESRMQTHDIHTNSGFGNMPMGAF